MLDFLWDLIRPRKTAGRNLADAKKPAKTGGIKLEIGEVKILDKETWRKYQVPSEVYRELGLAGQIAEKLMHLPYRVGQIERKSGKLMSQGKNPKALLADKQGLVCTPFARIFGAIWFEQDPLKQKKLGAGSKDPFSVKGSPALVYAKAYSEEVGISEFPVNDHPESLHALLSGLDASRLYCVVRYSKAGAREHVLFLIFSETTGDWVTIESDGHALGDGGKGPGPGIYPITEKKRRKGNPKRYKAWDWGPWYKPRSDAVEKWEIH